MDDGSLALPVLLFILWLMYTKYSSCSGGNGSNHGGVWIGCIVLKRVFEKLPVHSTVASSVAIANLQILPLSSIQH